ncbi:hypothetical protein [Flavobacterium sp.]|uniref:hypothetical protein n=1 Tax=Flavobacterium sp. TaxID=239 RepID=UPI0035B2E03F
MKNYVNTILTILVVLFGLQLSAQVTVLAPAGKQITIDKTTFGLSNVDNTSDSNKPVTTLIQNELNLKENIANKSLNITTDANSTIKYPSAKAVKTYTDQLPTWKLTGNSGGTLTLGYLDLGDGLFKIITGSTIRLKFGGSKVVATKNNFGDNAHKFSISSIQIQDGTEGSGKFLMSDANGLASWRSIDFTALYEGFTLRNTLVVPIVSPYTGKVWMDRNLGATQRATSKTDFKSYGQLYQWGRGNDGHADYYIWNTQKIAINETTSATSATDYPENFKVIVAQNLNDWRTTPNVNLWQGVDGINNPCPYGYRIPTQAEFQAEITGANITDADSAFNSFLKLPAAGIGSRHTGVVTDLGVRGLYWNSTVGYNTYSFSTSISNYNEFNSYIMSVRCIKN